MCVTPLTNMWTRRTKPPSQFATVVGEKDKSPSQFATPLVYDRKNTVINE